MNLAVAVQDILLATSGVTAIVGTGSSAKVWNDWQRTGDVPCVVVEIDGEEEQNDLDGIGELIFSELTVTCRAATEAGAHALWLVVRRALAAYAGGGLDLIVDDTQHARVPKDDGSTGHWYDYVISVTAQRTEEQ